MIGWKFSLCAMAVWRVTAAGRWPAGLLGIDEHGPDADDSDDRFRRSIAGPVEKQHGNEDLSLITDLPLIREPQE